MSYQDIILDQNPWWKDPEGYRRGQSYPGRRDLFPVLFEKLFRFDDRRASVVMGPRQVGKTVLLQQLVDELLKQGWPPANVTYFDFSDDRLAGPPLSPRSVIDEVPIGLAKDKPRFLFLDEIGSAESWALWLKQAVDTTNHRVVVTDSAAALLHQGARESGMGRWDEHVLEGLSFREFLTLQAREGEEQEDLLTRLPSPLERYLSIGGFPEHIRADSLPDVRRRLRSDIADRAILRDLVRTGTRQVTKVKDLFVYLVADSGALFDLRKRSEDLDADPRSVNEWLAALEETLLIARLEPFARKRTAKLKGRNHPKLFAADHGLVVAFDARVEPLADPEVRGKVFEAAVFRHLREVARRREWLTGFYRAEDQASEIDFILTTKDSIVAIEVTSSPDPGKKPAKLMRAREHLGLTSRILVYGGLQERRVNDVHLVPMHRFLLDPEGFLASKK